MFRTVTVYTGEKMTVRDNWMVVSGPDGEKSVPIEDIYSVVIDNRQLLFTVPVIERLTSSGAHILLCDDKHLPKTLILPQNLHYHPLTVIRRQMALNDVTKAKLWDEVVKAKIRNQAAVLRYSVYGSQKRARLLELAEEVNNGDIGNREGIAAKMYFHELYGFGFVRFLDNTMNAALNYGYAVIRSAVAKTLVAYGFNCVLGIHHINEADSFNLAEDIMEPFRPIVDYWVAENHLDLTEELTKQQKNELAALVNAIVIFDGKRMCVRTAIDRCVSTLTAAMQKADPSLLKLPTIIKWSNDKETDV